jgi:hypothetical protein
VTSAARGARRARLLVVAAAVAGAVTLALLALLALGLTRQTGPGPALGRGIAAFGTAGFAVGLLVLARAGALARGGSSRARGLYNRCLVGALVGAAAALVGGAVAAVPLRSTAPPWGGAVAGFLLALLVALALRLRATTLRTTTPSDDHRHRPGGGGASDTDRTAGSR